MITGFRVGLIATLSLAAAIFWCSVTADASVDCKRDWGSNPEKCPVIEDGLLEEDSLMEGPAAGKADDLGPSRVSGVRMRKGWITSDHPMPRDGLRLYVYVLPNYGVNPAMLEALLAFHDCLYATTKADLPGEVALLLLPFKLDGYQREVDLDLSYQILRAIPSERARKPGEVYVVGANGPIDPHSEARGTIIEIRVGGVGPEHIGVWLARLQQMVERDHTIGSPRRLDLRISSILTKVTSKGELIWHFKTAVAAPFRCR